MAARHVNAVLRHLRRLVGAREAEEASDASLLRRFLAARDEEAFEVLVRRHGPLVWDVCRSVLGHAHDAEDAFQATFLVLACRARSIRKQEAVGSWLYGVAHRLAAKARGEAARRRTRERQVPDMPESDRPLPEEGEARAALHEELQHLAEKYRAPIVLFYLQGNSYEETARLLRCPLGTLKSRLARGREALRSRLARRGIALSAALLVPAAARGVPAALLSAAVRVALLAAAGDLAAAGGVSARAVTLAREALHALALHRLQTALAVLLAVAVAALGAGLAARRGPDRGPGAGGAPPPARDAHAAEKPTPDAGRPPGLTTGAPVRLSASGRVLDPGGRPVAGATVHLREWTVWRTWGPADDLLATTTTDAEGRFSFRDVTARPPAVAWHARQHPWEVLVLAGDGGITWRHLTPRARENPLTLRLAPAGEVRGLLQDPSGRPVVGAAVSVLSVSPLCHYETGTPQARDDLLHLQHSRVALGARSDTGGRFVLRGLPRDRLLWLLATSEGHLAQPFYAATAKGPLPGLIRESSFGGKRFVRVDPVHAGEVTLTLRPAGRPRGDHRVRGRVVCADSGRPVPGARVWLDNGPEATADGRGRFTLRGVSPGPWTLNAHDGREPAEYLGARCALNVRGDREEVQQTVRLPRGVALAGRAVDETIGEGVGQVEVTYQARGPGALPPLPTRARTRPDGRFRLLLPPGAWTVRAYGGSAGYYPAVERRVDVRPGRASGEVVFALRRGVEVRGRVHDPGGKPVPGARVGLERLEVPGLPPWESVTDATGTFTLRGLPPGLRARWVLVHAGRRLGARVATRLPADPRSPLRVDLKVRPLGAVSGRVLGAGGKPLAGAAVCLNGTAAPAADGAGLPLEPVSLTTDAGGRFRFDTLLPAAGYRYSVTVSAPGFACWRSPGFSARSGRTLTLPDLVLPQAGEVVSGKVVDPGGLPLANVRVSAGREAPGGGSLVGPGPAVTGPDGRFRVAGLARGPVTLEAVRYTAGQFDASARPGPSARVRVEAGRRDVRLVLGEGPPGR